LNIVPPAHKKSENSFTTSGSFGIGAAIGAGYNAALSFAFGLSSTVGLGAGTMAGIGTFSATQSPLGSIFTATASALAVGGATLYYSGYKTSKWAYNKIKDNERLDLSATTAGIGTGFALASAVPYLILSDGMTSLGNKIENIDFSTESITSPQIEAPTSSQQPELGFDKNLEYIVAPA
jgi:hypothetical protein